MYKRWIQVFAAVDIVLSCIRLGSITLHLTSQCDTNAAEDDGKELEEAQVRLYEDFDETKYLMLRVLFYILHISILSLAVFLMVAISEENGLKQIRRIRIWTGGTSMVILIHIIYLIRRLYFLEDILHRDSPVRYYDLCEILLRFLFAVFVNKYTHFINADFHNNFDDIDPEIRLAFQKYVFQTEEPVMF